MASFDSLRVSSLVSVAILTSLAACGGGEEENTGAAVLSLEGPELPTPEVPSSSSGDSEPSTPSVGTAEPTEASAPTQPEVEATPAAAKSGMSGARALDTWHRSLPEGREDVLDRCDGESATVLAELGRALNGEAKAYRASLRIEIPEAMGEEFARYARAYAEGDVEQLATVLPATPEPSPAWMVWTEALAHMAIEQQNDRVGGPALGRLLQAMLNLGYSRDRVLGFRSAAEGVGRRAGDSMPYDTYEVQSGEAMYNVRLKQRREGRKLDYLWIAEFNDKSNYNLRVGETLKIPQQELHIEVWRGARVVVVFAGDRPIRIYPCSVGKEGEETPVEDFTIGIKETNPVYYGVSPAVPYGNPDNPLGDRWLGFEERTSYGLHGTNSESTIGTRETEGCVRMHNSDVRELFDLVPVSTLVKIHP